MSSRGESRGDVGPDLPLGEGAIFGAAAYVAGYVLTAVLLAVDDEADSSVPGASDAIGETDVVGWIFYNAHFVDVEASVGSVSTSGDLLSESIGETGIGLSYQFPTLVYRLVPIVVLVAAGYVLVDSLEAADDGDRDGATNGSALVVGYLPLALLGAFVFEVSGSIADVSASVGPDPAMAALLAGVVFPVVLGAAGGYLGAAR